MQTQIQMVKPKEEIITKYVLSSPWNFFLQIDQNFINKGLIYWFGYSMGKIKTAAWGHFDQLNNKMSITGSCKFSIRQLIPILNLQKKNDYLYVASGTENKIDKIVLDYLDKSSESQMKLYKKIFSGSLNRVDLMGGSAAQIIKKLTALGLNPVDRAIYLKYVIDLTKVFLNTVETNESLVTKMATTICANRDSCSEVDYNEICEVYFHGSAFYLDPEDERYDELFMLS